MTDHRDLEKEMGWPLSDEEFTVLSDLQSRFVLPVDQLVALLHLMREQSPLTAADFQEDRAPKRKRIHDRRPWPVPKRQASNWR